LWQSHALRRDADSCDTVAATPKQDLESSEDKHGDIITQHWETDAERRDAYLPDADTTSRIKRKEAS
jgi:hypothetical protein